MRLGFVTLSMALAWAPLASAQSTIPSTFPVFTDDFETTLENWIIAPGSALGIGGTGAHTGSGGLEVTVFQAESHVIRGGRRDLARADEAYLTFWFDPNGVALNDPGSGFIPGRSIQIAAIQGPGFKNLVAIRFRETGSGYEGFLEWRDAADTAQFDYALGSFPLVDGWQRITIGFRKDAWIACWIGSSNVRSVTGLDHLESYGSVVQIGKTLTNSLISPTGVLLFDDAEFHLPRITDLWVDQASGSDAFDGLTPGTAFATIGRAASLAGAGTTVHIQPGVYRESVVPAQGGLASEPVLYKAENGVGTVVVRGSETSAGLNWTQLTSNTIGLPGTVDPGNVWWTDLSAWSPSGAPRFVVRMTGGGRVAERLPLAREPDWPVTTPHKHSEWWWTAEGGASLAACDPKTDADPDCDFPSRSSLQLTDPTDDALPAGIESGNLTSLGDLTGATLVARDARLGHYQYRRTIVSHNTGSGRVTVDSPCTRTGSDPGLGWGSQYYVEGHPSLLDSPGEWWFDDATSRLYLWAPGGGDPAALALEISRRAVAFDLINLSYVTLQSLDLELFEDVLIDDRNFIWHRSVGNSVLGCSLSFAETGLALRQEVPPTGHADKSVSNFLIEGNEIAHMDFNALQVSHFWEGGSQPDDWVRPGTFDVTIRGNFIHHIGFRTPAGADSPSGVVVQYGDRIVFENNTLSDFAHDGLILLESVIQSSASWGFPAAEIVTGQILVKGNVIERACQLKNDCGALKIWGLAPDHHVFRDLLVVGNDFRDTVGWGWPAEQRSINSDGQIAGAGGNGLYVDHTSGVAAYRNIAYNNGLAGIHLVSTWRDGRILLYNNVVADNVFGIRFGGLFEDTHLNFDTRAENNVLVNNEAHGLLLSDLDSDYTNTLIDRNLYFGNGWRSAVFKPGAMKINHRGSQEFWQTVAEIQANTAFETFGQEANPLFLTYDPDDHNPLDGSRPDFRLAVGSPAADAGTQNLPSDLADLLTLFGIAEVRTGPRWDQGAFEGTQSCDDLTVSDLEVTGPELFQTCGTLRLGPAFHITRFGRVTAQAGHDIVLDNGFSMDLEASLTADSGL